ncbi:MAG: metallophosphoesterase [Candidatus Woesearchaeota archaeon]
MPKFLIIGDLHGQKPSIHFRDFDAIIAVGDFCSDKEIKKIDNPINYQKFLNDPYSYKPWHESVKKSEAKRIVLDSIRPGRRILEFLNSFGVPVFIVPGNWDFGAVSRYDTGFLGQNFFKTHLISGLENVVDIHKKIRNFGGYTIIGYGNSSGPELFKHRGYDKIFRKKDVLKNKKEYSILVGAWDALFRKAKARKKPVIFLSHNVPYNTPLDTIRNKQSIRRGWHYGSLVTREMIDRYQPLVCIGGHMHEYFQKCSVGKTTAINAGFGGHVNTLLEISGDKIKKIEFYRARKEQGLNMMRGEH